MKDGTEPFRTVFFVYLPIMRRRQFLKYAGAAGLAAAIMAASLTGCTDPDKLKTGGTAEISVDEENIKVVQDSITAGIVSIVFE